MAELKSLSYPFGHVNPFWNHSEPWAASGAFLHSVAAVGGGGDTINLLKIPKDVFITGGGYKNVDGVVTGSYSFAVGDTKTAATSLISPSIAGGNNAVELFDLGGALSFDMGPQAEENIVFVTLLTVAFVPVVEAAFFVWLTGVRVAGISNG